MKIKNSSINTLMAANNFFTKKSNNVLSLNLKKKKENSAANTMTNILNAKNQMNDIINKTKVEDMKKSAQLEKEKQEYIDDIKDICSKYSDQLSVGLGYSQGLNDIVLGNVDAVTRTMDFNYVSNNISNLEYSIIHSASNSLKQYYSEGDDKKETFSQYMGDNTPLDIDKVMSSNTVSDDIKGQLGALDSLLGGYRSLYKTIDKINEFKQESAQRLAKLQKNMENNIKKISEYSLDSEQNSLSNINNYKNKDTNKQKHSK